LGEKINKKKIFIVKIKKNMKKIFLIITFFLFVGSASANNLELAKLLRDEKGVIDAGWDNPNSLWVVFYKKK
jgi:hypothetical protein